MNERLNLLADMPAFGGLNSSTLELVAALAQPVAVPAGEHFFREGDVTQAMYVLQAGKVESSTLHGRRIDELLFGELMGDSLPATTFDELS